MGNKNTEARIAAMIATKYGKRADDEIVRNVAAVCANIIASHFDTPPPANTTQGVNGGIAEGVD